MNLHISNSNYLVNLEHDKVSYKQKYTTAWHFLKAFRLPVFETVPECDAFLIIINVRNLCCQRLCLPLPKLQKRGIVFLRYTSNICINLLNHV